jgi:predicted Zn-dependent peptidase
VSALTVQPRPDLGAPVDWSFPPLTTTRMGPGLVVHQLHLPGRDLVAVDLRMDAPITLDPPGSEGLALITSRALDEGSAHRDGDAFAAALDRIGADVHTGAGTSGTRVSLDVPAANLAPALDLLAEAVTEPVFPPREVDRLVQQRTDAIRQQLARPDQRIGMAVREVMLAGHRCALPNGGTLETVPTIDRDATAAFHAEHALTGPATLVVAGDLSGIDVEEVVARRLGHFLDVDREAHDPVPVAVGDGPRVVVVDKPGAVQTQLALVRRGPDRRSADWVPARVATYVLGGTLTSRLDMVLREEKGYTYGIRSQSRTYRRGGLVELAGGSVDTPNTGESVRLALDIVGRLAAEGPTQEERDAAVDFLVGIRPLALETPRALASEIGRNLGDDLPPTHTDTELGALRGVTVDEVAAAAATHLRPDDCTVVAVGDADEVVAALDALGHADVEVRRD